MSKNQNVSAQSHTSPLCITTPTILASTPLRPLPFLAFFCDAAEVDDAGTCRRHITQGMMKYRGSTRGAVIRESAVERMNMSTKEVLGSSFCSVGLADGRLEGCGTGADGFLSVRYVK